MEKITIGLGGEKPLHKQPACRVIAVLSAARTFGVALPMLATEKVLWGIKALLWHL